MKPIIMVIGLIVIFVGSIFLLGKEGEQAPEQGTKRECDLKNVQRFQYCPKEDIVLRGFRCLTCASGKCKWYADKSKELANDLKPLPPGYKYTGDGQKRHDAAVKTLNEHMLGPYYAMSKLKDFKCPCCATPLKGMEETDLVVNKKCRFCQWEKLKQEEFCVKYVYGCSDGHKGVLIPSDYNNLCPELVEDANGKKKECKKPLDKMEVSIEEVINKYICPSCKERFDKRGKCPVCNKDLTKIKACAKSGTFPHIDGKEWEKEQKAKREEAKKN